MVNKKIFFVAITAVVFLAGNILAEGVTGVTFLSTLQIGESSPAVLALQKLLNNDPDTQVAESGVGSPGQETNYFGGLTKIAVIRFQEKYKDEVLTPVGLLKGTGFVGMMTIRKLNELANAKENVAQNQVKTVSSSVYQSPPSPVAIQSESQNSLAPVVLSVSPNKVRRGDVVVVKGKNFTPVNNILILGDGPIKERFDGLASLDGETLTFVYEPPAIKTMTKEQILAMPGQYLDQIEEPLKKVGATLDDAITPFKGINSEAELREMLERNGHSFDEMYHYFYVLVFNSHGSAISQTAVLHGLRDFPFDNVAVKAGRTLVSKFSQDLTSLIGSFTSIARAQSNQQGGGFTTGIVLACTCNGNTLTFQISFSGGGSGLYVFTPGFRPDTGTGLVSGQWLGGYQQSGGTCEVGVRPYCATITGNTPQNPVGYSM